MEYISLFSGVSEFPKCFCNGISEDINERTTMDIDIPQVSSSCETARHELSHKTRGLGIQFLYLWWSAHFMLFGSDDTDRISSVF